MLVSVPAMVTVEPPSMVKPSLSKPRKPTLVRLPPNVLTPPGVVTTRETPGSPITREAAATPAVTETR